MSEIFSVEASASATLQAIALDYGFVIQAPAEVRIAVATMVVKLEAERDAARRQLEQLRESLADAWSALSDARAEQEEVEALADDVGAVYAALLARGEGLKGGLLR